MARRLIGLDIGTNAVTIAEVTPGTPPRLDMFAQVALPREAMREGEIADEAAVTDAVARLRHEVGLKRAVVRVGIASPRVVVRQVEMPVMTRDELASALQFQAGDLIPIPVEDAVLDFSILGNPSPQGDGEGGEPTMQVLLAAAYEATVLRLVSAVEAGGFQVGAVDLVPLALTRALTHPAMALAAAGSGGGVAVADDVGAEGIVSFGGGVTAIAVHENGIPRFVRVLGSGGRELTDAIATDLNVPAETAEALKRALGSPSPDETVLRARTSIDRPLSVLLDEVRSSIDYYRNQPGAARLARVVVTGGSAQLPGLPERLSALVGVPVEPAFMHDLLRIGDIGFAPDELPRLEPYLPAPVGLALGDAGVGVVVDLSPRHGRSARRGGARNGLDQRLVAAGIAGILVLGGLTFLKRQDVSSAKSAASKAAAEVKTLREQYRQQQERLSGGKPQTTGDLRGEVATTLANDVSWPQLVDGVGAHMPAGVWLTSLQGQHTVAAPAAGAAGSSASSSTTGTSSGSAAGTSSSGATGTAGTAAAAPSAYSPSAPCAALPSPAGTLTLSGIAKDMPTLASFLDALKSDPDVAAAWVGNAQKSKFGTADVYVFTLNAQLSSGARGHRFEQFFGRPACK